MTSVCVQWTMPAPSSSWDPPKTASTTTCCPSSPTSSAPAFPVRLRLQVVKQELNRQVSNVCLALSHRYDSPSQGLRGGWAGLPLCGVTGTDGAGHPVAPLHRGGAVQQPPVRDVGAECATGGRAGDSPHFPTVAVSTPTVAVL